MATEVNEPYCDIYEFIEDVPSTDSYPNMSLAINAPSYSYYSFSEVCAQSRSPSTRFRSDGLISYNSHSETLLKHNEGDVFSKNSTQRDSSQGKNLNYNYVDVNNNIQCIKKEVTLDDTFEDMINETYESMMKNQVTKISEDSVSKPPNPDFQASLVSSPKVVKLKNILPKKNPGYNIFPCNDPGQYYIHGNLVKVTPQLFDHHHHASLPSLPPHQQVAGTFPHPSLMEMITVQKDTTSPSLPHSFTPMSYTWKGFHGGLQRNTVVKQKSLAGPGGKSRSLFTWPSPLKPNHQTCKVLPKHILNINNSQLIFKKVVPARPNQLVSLLKPTSDPLSIIITKPPVKYQLGFNTSLDPFTGKPKMKKPKTNKQKFGKPKMMIPVISPSGWVTRVDPVKIKKNQLERERRWEMAIYREKLRKMLPITKDTKKVASVTVLGEAKDYCVKIQAELHKLELSKLVEERRKEELTWRLARLKYHLKLPYVFPRVSL